MKNIEKAKKNELEMLPEYVEALKGTLEDIEYILNNYDKLDDIQKYDALTILELQINELYKRTLNNK